MLEAMKNQVHFMKKLLGGHKLIPPFLVSILYDFVSYVAASQFITMPKMPCL